MKAVVYARYGVTPALTEVADPACPADGVVIAVGATGVCRSDWHAWQGHDPVPSLPHIAGPDPAGPGAAAGPGGRGGGPVSLARLPGPRPGPVAAAHRRARAGRDGGGRRPRGEPVAARGPGDG